MRVRLFTLLLAIIAGTVSGCANRPRLARDPFLPFRNRPAAATAADDQTPQRDLSRDVSTSPATDPFYGSTATSPTLLPKADTTPQDDPKPQAVAQNDPPPPVNSTETPAVPATGNSNPAMQFASDSKQLVADYSVVRQRLDAAGVRNWRSERDEKTGEFNFYCEVPIPDNPELAQAFEAKDKEELRAMLAVTEAVEKWLREQTARPASP